MSWRKRFLLWFGPSILGGITFGDWIRLLRENRFDIHPSYWLRAAIITASSLGNSLDRRREEATYGRAIRDAIADPPVFVLGIWRSGTTHLQNLLAVDERFAFPNWYQVAYPHSFLGTEAKRSKVLGFFIPETRIQDNMQYGLQCPAEDEFALCTTSARSPLLSSVFPRRAEHYARYGTLSNVSEAEVAEWQAAILWFVKKLACKNGKPLVLKSPFHTGRIRLLLEHLSRGEVRPHPPRSLRCFPIGVPYDARGDELLRLAAARPGCGGMDDSPISRARRRFPRGEGSDSGWAVPRASVR